MRSLVVFLGATLAVIVLGLVLAPLFTRPRVHPPVTKATEPSRSLLDQAPSQPPVATPPTHNATTSQRKPSTPDQAPLVDNPALAGLELAPADSAMLARMHVPKDRQHGLVVTSIDPASSAAEAHLQVGDLLTRVQRDNIVDLESFKRSFGDRDYATIELFREGKPFYIVLHKPYHSGGK